ncbi:MAG: response regulator transcription factor, partial [Proteobacteria bacterium]|nr:response regulator transcription factor [Pseudomonadota bacterium]
MDWTLVPEEVGLYGAEVVILSNELPDTSTIDVLTQLRKDSGDERAVLVLLPEVNDTARIDALLEGGADDVIVGPVIPRVLVNRIRMMAVNSSLNS